MVMRKNAWINGQEVQYDGNDFIKIINPAKNEVIAEVQACTEKEVDLAVEAAEKAFESFKETTPQERSNMLFKLADLVEKHYDEFVELESQNTGKPLMVSRADVEYFIENLRYFAGAARHISGLGVTEYVKNHTSMIRREPVGVVASITPWNYPLMMAGWKIGPAIAAGNTVVLKPSELTPLTTLKLAELSKEVFPDGVFNVIPGYGDPVGVALSRHPKVKMISLTGSVRAGQSVAREAAGTLKKVHLELGGKAPFIVFDDANIDDAVQGVRFGAYLNSGQDCTAVTRIYVHKNIFDEFTEKLVAEVKTIKIGDPFDENTELGPVISEAHLNRVDGFVQRALNNPNAKVLTGGKKVDGPGFYYEPTVIVGVDQSDEIVQNEVFGPVVTVIPFTDIDEVIQLANDCKYGLASSVWTKDINKATKVQRALEFGCVWTNTHFTICSEMPHGGFKLSGYGKDQSIYALEEYMQIKHVMVKFDE